MDHTYVDAKSLKTLEDYAIALASGMLSLKTLENFHIRAVEIGILSEELSCKANTIVWDLRRDIKLYQELLEGVLELLPDDFNAGSIIEKMKKMEITKARQMTRKPRKKKDE